MTVKRLIEILKEAPQQMPVYLGVGNEGIFSFSEPCEEETGIITLGPNAEIAYRKDQINVPVSDEFEGKEVFAILPHGFFNEEWQERANN